MIPGWKIKRELKRLGYQIWGIPKYFASLPEKLRHDRRIEDHDLNFAQLVSVTAGNVTATKKFAVFLIYQPKGIAASVFLTLNYLRAHGYSIIAVMNSKLLDDDLIRLQDCCWKIVTRPNFGYDFGGYRDGLRILRESVEDADRVLIMNDSVWFPMGGDPVAWIEKEQDSEGYDVFGLNQDQKVRYQKDGSQKFEQRHIESYFFMVSAECWNSDDFKSFWDSYRMSSDKPYTIKNGEMGFSKYMMARGAKFGGHLKRSNFLEAIILQSNDFLRDTLFYAAYVETRYSDERDALLQRFGSGPEWRDQALAHISNMALRRPFNVCFCYAADHIFGTAYLKKNSQAYFHRMRKQFLRAISDGKIAAPDPIILSEISEMVRQYDIAPPPDAEKTL